jgi:peptidyl-dipeptidase Dcp
MVLVSACAQPEIKPLMDKSRPEMNIAPFLSESALPLNYPQFNLIRDTDYRPAFEQGMAEQQAEVDVIVNNVESPNFENTVVALERSGRLLERVQRIFFNLVSADTNALLDEIQSEMAPKLSGHSDEILLNSALFARIKNVRETHEALPLDEESRRLIEEYYTDFVRAGALLSDKDKQRLRNINGELATLQTKFSQNVLSEVNKSAVVVDTRDELLGLPDAEIAAAGDAATARELDGKYAIPLLNTSAQPTLASLQNRALRQRLLEASLTRGSKGGDFDNRNVITQIAKLRAERATLLGYPTYAAYSLERQTAQTVQTVNERLASLVPAAVANARGEAADLQAAVAAEGKTHPLAPWDWSYYSEQVRAKRYAFDRSQLRPYLELDNVLQNGVFYAANRLFGVTFQERSDLPVYHPDVRVFDVFDVDGDLLALFIADHYARPSKRGGAWMNAFVSQSDLLGTKAVAANYLNISKPTSGEPTLLTFDEVETMFHEFGHALHEIFSSVRYPYFSGTSVPRDFVEFPSQVNEMWARWPEVLKNYAVHYQTGKPIPTALLEKVLEMETFNQGFATTEYLAASLLDQAWHQLTVSEIPNASDVTTFEKTALSRAGVGLETVPPRYRSTYFSHIWSSGYAAGYYSYIWAEVLDADSVEWFRENGGLTRENGNHFRQTLLSKGGSQKAMDLFRTFRGREPDIGPLLVRRGLR